MKTVEQFGLIMIHLRRGTGRALGLSMRSVLLFAALCSLPAFATGEKIVLTPVNSPLVETLCVSMSCVSDGAHDVTVAAKEVKGALQFTVTSASGQVKLVTTASLTESGTVSSTDLVRASALIVKAIEGPSASAVASESPAAAKSAKATKTAKKSGKGGKRQMVAHR